MKTSGLSVLTLLLAFFGIADAWYLTQSAYTGSPLTCDVTGLDGCNTVAQSAYAHLFGYPLALYGVFFFGLLFVLAAVALFTPRRMIHLGMYALGIIGLIASIIFIGIQLLLIKAICIYCFASAFASFLIFGLTYTIWKREQRRHAPPIVLPWETPSVLP